jgi:iron complex transport system substrate-binding protein
LEQQNKLVGCTSYCDTAVADGKEVVASAVKVNIEKVVSLKPDLVITTTMTNPETLDMLRNSTLGLKHSLQQNRSTKFASKPFVLVKLLEQRILLIKVVADSQTKIKNLTISIKNNKSPNIFFQIGAKPLFTVIPGTFMNDYIVFAGGKNVVTNTKTGSITREAVIASNPDVIFVVTMGIVGEEEKRVWEGYSTINAAKNKKVFIIDSNDSCTPTPVTFVKTLERIINLIYSK